MAKTHFGADEIGTACSGGMRVAPQASLDWNEVDCKSCRTRRIMAGELQREAIIDWLVERIADNDKRRAQQAAWQAKHEADYREKVAREDRLLHSLHHDFKVQCPDDFIEIRKLAPSYWQPQQELRVQSKASAVDRIVVTVSSHHRDGAIDTFDIAWPDVIVDTRSEHLIERAVPTVQVIPFWKLGADKAKSRWIHQEYVDDEDVGDWT